MYYLYMHDAYLHITSCYVPALQLQDSVNLIKKRQNDSFPLSLFHNSIIVFKSATFSSQPWAI